MSNLKHQAIRRVLLGLTAIACLGASKGDSVSSASAKAQLAPSKKTESRIAVAESMPPMRGSQLRATLLEVTYPPGGYSVAHTHACPVIGFVLSGALRFQVDHGPEQMLRAGQSFYETPNSVHKVSANASRGRPAKFLAYFVCDGEQDLTKPLRSGTR